MALYLVRQHHALNEVSRCIVLPPRGALSTEIAVPSVQQTEHGPLHVSGSWHLRMVLPISEKMYD